MHAVVLLLQNLVSALAAASFAHFGLALKEPPAPKPQPAVVQRLPAATALTPAADMRVIRLQRDIRAI